MTSGWGVDATVNGSGVATSGTESADVRKVWGGLFTPGIVDGCTITRSGSAMTYTVAAGVAAIKTATKEVVMAPIALTTISTTAAPASGSRVDLVYAEQMFPASGSSDVIIRVSSFANLASVVVPANSVALGKYLVSAGQTNTNAATPQGSTDYAIPYGTSKGTLHYYQYTASDIFQPELQRFGHGNIYLPTDRRVRFNARVVMHAVNAVGFDNTKYCSYGFLPSYDNVDFLNWQTPGLHQAWQTIEFGADVTMTAGTHPVNLGALRMEGPGLGQLHYGVDSLGFFRRGMEFWVEDIGPAI